MQLILAATLAQPWNRGVKAKWLIEQGICLYADEHHLGADQAGPLRLGRG